MRGQAYRALWLATVVVMGASFPNVSLSASNQSSLTGPQAVAFRNSLTAVLTAVNAQRFNSRADKDSALSDGIERVANQIIHSGGASIAGAMTSEIIAVAESNRVPEADVGRALGVVAVQISPCSAASDRTECDSAKQVAQTVANEGTGAMADAFVAAVTGSGGSVDLAAVALGVPQITSAIPGSVSGHPTFGSYMPPPAPPPACDNPSCS